MKIVIQRVSKATVKVGNQVIGQIGQGLLVFLGVKVGDSELEVSEMAKKILRLRIFENEDNKFDLSLLDIKGGILVIPQFTLFADCSKGNRPFFGEAAKPKAAEPLFDKFVVELKKSGLKVEKGQFGAKMEIESVNNGPVTIVLEQESERETPPRWNQD